MYKTLNSHRSELDRQLEALEDGLLELASRVEKATTMALHSLKNRDHNQALQVIAGDKSINEQRYEIEREALTLLTLQQPLATRDLRYVVASIQIASELERMGDYAKGVARISETLPSDPPLAFTVLLEEMGRQASQLLRAAMDAFVDQDREAASRVAGRDEVLDELYTHTQKRLIEGMVKEPALIDLLTPLLWAAHNLERIGDRVTNICGRINFIQTGQVRPVPLAPKTDIVD